MKPIKIIPFKNSDEISSKFPFINNPDEVTIVYKNTPEELQVYCKQPVNSNKLIASLYSYHINELMGDIEDNEMKLPSEEKVNEFSFSLMDEIIKALNSAAF